MRMPLLLACLVFFPLSAHAHKIHVFAWASGSTVTVESSFSGHRPLVNGKVTVKDSGSDTVFLEGTGDAKGIFTFEVPDTARAKGADLLIVVSGGEGHQSEWLLPAEEYRTTSPAVLEKVPAAVGNEELKLMLQELLQRELAPIKRSLAENRQGKAGFREIIGGIGYLLGLAGLVAWLRNRPPQRKEDK